MIVTVLHLLALHSFGGASALAGVPFDLQVVDMSKDYAAGFYASTAWHRCRAAYIAHRQAVDGGMCERCHEQLGLIVHHKTHISPANIGNPVVTLSFDNLEYLCHDCHDKEHGMRGDARFTITFDACGNPVSRR